MANSASYLVKFGADAKSVSKAISQVNGEIRSAGNEAKSLNNAFKFTGDASTLTASMKALQRQISLTDTKAEGLKIALANMRSTKGFDENSSAATRLKGQIAQTEAQSTELKAKLQSMGSASSGMDEATNKTSKLKNGFSALTVTAGTLVANGIQAVVSAISGLGSEMVSSSDAVQKFNSTMKFAGTSSAQIQKVGAEGKKYANDTVYDLQTILNTTAQLASNSVPNYDKLVQASGNLNAVAGGNADTFKSVAMVLTQTAGEGKLTTENWNQLTDAIAGASGPLQAQMKKNGDYTGNFRQAMSDGKISSDEFNKAIMQLGMTDVAKKAATATNTFEGSFGNLEAAVVTLGQAFLDKLKGPITDTVNTITNMIGPIQSVLMSMMNSINFDGLGSSLSGLGTSILPIFQTLGTNIKTMFSNIFGSIATDFSNVNWGASISAVSGIFQSLGTVVNQIVSSISDAFSRMDFSGIANIANAILPALQSGFQTFLSYVTPAIQPLVSAFVGLWNAIQPVATIIASVLQPVFNALGAFLGGVFSGAMSTITTLFNVLSGVIQFLTPVIQLLANVFKAVEPAIQGVIGWIGSMIGSGSALSSAFSIIGRVIGTVWSGISSAVGVARGVLSSEFGIIKTAFSAVGSLFNAVFGIIRGIFSGVSGAASSLGGGLSSIFGGIRSAFSAVGSLFSSVGSFIMSVPGRIIGAFSGVGSKIAQTFSGVVGKIKGFFNGVENIGENIVKGIASGITGSINWLLGVIKSFAHKVTDGVKSFFGIHSPSRVMRDQVGTYITQGIGVGMDKAIPTLNKPMSNIKSSIVSGVSDINPNVSTSGYNALSNGLLANGTSTTDSSTTMVFNIEGGQDSQKVAQAVKAVLRQQGYPTR